jgi:hypothetical protein
MVSVIRATFQKKMYIIYKFSLHNQRVVLWNSIHVVTLELFSRYDQDNSHKYQSYYTNVQSETSAKTKYRHRGFLSANCFLYESFAFV